MKQKIGLKETIEAMSITSRTSRYRAVRKLDAGRQVFDLRVYERMAGGRTNYNSRRKREMKRRQKKEDQGKGRVSCKVR
jgi:hypothetical protein